MHRQGVFITGTDTGVGKTAVSAALLALLRTSGVDAVPMKPIQTGAFRRNGRWLAPDLEFCLAMAQLKPDRAEYSLMAPCCYSKACSPHLAAALTGRRIERRRVMAACNALAARHAMVVVEGAGGVGAPLDRRHTMLDLMNWLDLPVVVVARLGLGTLNHTWLTLRILRQARIRVLGVVFNPVRPGRLDYIERDNIRTIARQGAVRVLGRLPFIPEMENCSAKLFRRAIAGALPRAADLMKWLG